MNGRPVYRAGPPPEPHGATVSGSVDWVLRSESKGPSEALPRGLWPPAQPASRSDQPASDSGYVLHLYGGQWYAARQLVNGRKVSGIGPNADAAIQDLETNWRVS